MNIEEIIEKIPDKIQNKETISTKFRLDFCDFMNQNKGDFLTKTCIELGTCQGYSTKMLSYFFKKVITFEELEERTNNAKDFNSDVNNIEYQIQDIYNTNWWDIKEDVGLVFIDADHTYECVKSDFENSLKLPFEAKLYIVFDDYGAFEAVRRLVDESLESGKIKFCKFLGESKGFVYRNDKPALQDREGVVCVYEK